MGKNKHKKNNKQTSSPIIQTNPNTPNILEPIKEERSPELLSLEPPVNKLVEPIDNTLEHSTIREITVEEPKELVEVVAEKPKEPLETALVELKEPVEPTKEEPIETVAEPTKEETVLEPTKEEPKVTLEQLKEPEPPKKEEILEKPNTTVTNKKQSFCVIF